MSWAVRIDLTSSKIPVESGRVSPVVYWPGELSILLHSGEATFYSLGAEDPFSEIWYASYIPSGVDLDLDRAIELVAGGDLAQLREISLAIANQVSTGEFLTTWLEDTFDGLTLDGATIRVYSQGPTTLVPEPSPDWTGIIRSARPLGTRIQMRCEPPTMADQVGNDVGGGKIEPLVYGQGLKVRLPQVDEIDDPINPMDQVLSRPIRCVPIVGVPDATHVDIAAWSPDPVRARLPAGPVVGSDWFVEIVAGAGRGQVRRITPGSTLVHSQELPGYPEGSPSGYPSDWWRIQIEEQFVDPDTRASILDLASTAGGIGNFNRSTVRIVRRSKTFATPAHLTANDVILGNSRTFVKAGDSYIEAQNFERIWEQGDTTREIRAISSPFKTGSWAIFQHINPETDFEYLVAYTSSPDEEDQDEIRRRLNNKETDFVTLFPFSGGDVRITFLCPSIHLPFDLGLKRIWGVAYWESDNPASTSDIQVYARGREGASSEFLYLLRDMRSFPSSQRDTCPPWLKPYPGRADWRASSCRIWDFGGNEARIDYVELRFAADSDTVRLGQLSLIAELEQPIGNVYGDFDGPSYDGSGDARVEEIWDDRLTAVSSTAAPTRATKIQDHVHVIEDLMYRHLLRPGQSVDQVSLEQAYLDLMAKTQPGLSLPPLANRPKANLVTTKSAQGSDLIAQLCRDGMLAGDFDGDHRLVLHAWLARSGLEEHDAVLEPGHIDRGSFQGFAATELSKLVTAPLIRYAVEDETPMRAIQILRPDAATYDPAFAIGFEDPDDAERAWEICHAAFLKSRLVHAREMVFASVPDYASIIALTLPPRGTTFFQWVGETKDQTVGLRIPSDHPAARLVLGSRIKLTDTLYCPGGRWGTLARNPLRLSTSRSQITLLMDLAP